MRNTFKSSELQEIFESLGYVIIPNFLSTDEIKALRDNYLSSNIKGKGFHATMHFSDIEYRRKTSSTINNIFSTKASELLIDYKQIVSNYTVKEPGKESFFDFHLDWNMVDETACKSITIWSPLEDTNENNGNLWILEASHQLGDSYRCGPGLSLYFRDPSELGTRKFEKKSLPMKAGDAIIYDHKLFHGSPPNKSNHARIAINQAMRPAEFPSLHYLSDNKGNIEVIEVDDDFYNRCIINKNMNDGKLINKIKLHHKPTQQFEVGNLIF